MSLYGFGLFLLIGLTFGGSVALIVLIGSHSLGGALVIGAFMGVFLSLIATPLIAIPQLLLTRGASTNAGVVVRRSAIVKGGSTREALRLAEGAMEHAMPRGRFTKRDFATGELQYRTSLSWKSWGEVVSARIDRQDDSACTLEVKSRPLFRPTLADFGKNQRNVEETMRWLSEQGAKAE